MMSLIWSTTNYPVSKLIRFAFQEPASHFSVVFDRKDVFHSSLFGLERQWWVRFQRENQIVDQVHFDFGLKVEEKVYQSLLELDGMPYDYGAFFYFGYRALLNRLFNTPLPRENPFGEKEKFLCTELAELLPEDIFMKGKPELPMACISPWALNRLILTGKVK